MKEENLSSNDKNQYSSFMNLMLFFSMHIDNQEEATKHELDYLIRDLALHPKKKQQNMN